MNMGQAFNFPSQYLMHLLSVRLEVSFLLGLGILSALFAFSPIKDRLTRIDANFFSLGGSVKFVFQKVLGMFWILDGLLQAQPSMPRGFIPMVVEPAMSSQPQWLEKIGNLGINMWTLHTVSTDAITVVVQILIGLMLVTGNDGKIAKIGLNLSIIWGLIVWTIAEGMGSIFIVGASILTGSPGAVLFYILAAVILLRIDKSKFNDGTAGKLLWNIVGAIFVFGAILQLLPVEGFFKKGGLSQIFQNAAANSQPGALRSPINWIVTISSSHFVLLNIVIALLFSVIGIGILSNRYRRFWLYVTAIVLFFVWWFGMDFGILGGVGTDLNSAPLIFLYLSVGYRSIVYKSSFSIQENSADRLDEKSNMPVQKSIAPALTFGKITALWLVVSFLIAAIWISLPDIGSFNQAVSTPQVETAALVDSGGLAQVPGNPPAPNFTLKNQHGIATSLSDFKGKVVILSFLDPVCYETCPVVAEEFLQTAKLLAKESSHMEFVAVNANPYFTAMSAINGFDVEHGLTTLNNWEFLTGTANQLKAVWSEYGAITEVPRVGMVAHSLLVYMISPSGNESELTQATGQPGINLELSYAQMFANEAGRLIGHA